MINYIAILITIFLNPTLLKASELKWVSAPDFLDGECYQDSKKVEADACIKRVIKTQVLEAKQKEKRTCLMFAESFNGQTIVLKTDFSKCLSKNSSYTFELAPSQLEGNCYLIDTDYRAQVKVHFCRPQKVDFKWRSENSKCYELHPQGAQFYIQETKNLNCLTEDLGFSYYLDRNLMTASCKQKFKTLNGNVIEIEVPLLNCKPQKTSFKFFKKSEMSGDCYEVGANNAEDEYLNHTNLSACRPPADEQKFTLFDDDGKSNLLRCLMVDKKSGGSHYIEKREIFNCIPKDAPYFWRCSLEGWGGRCHKISSDGKIDDSVFADDELCAPKKLSITWRQLAPFNGECYLVDAEKGAAHFSQRVPLVKCRPTEQEKLKYFYYVDQKGLGQCFLVDSTTMGKEYSELVDTNLCKVTF